MAYNDHFSAVARDYRKFRPGYPPEMFAFLAFVSAEHELAWDCATGSGQAAKQLANHFAQVFATDASESQIKTAEKVQNVKYWVSPAEKTNVPSSSVDLISVAQALHWFDIKKFYLEAERVLKPGGILAVWTYDVLRIQPNIDALIAELYSNILKPYWPKECEMVAQRYKDIQLPFQQIQCPVFKSGDHWTLHHLIGYLNTWSAVTVYQEQNGDNPLLLIYDKIAEIWGDSSNTYPVEWSIYLKASVKPGGN